MIHTPLLTQPSRVAGFNRFLRSPAYILSVSLAILLSSVFAWDIPLYTLLAALCCAICLYGDDLLPLTPIITQIHMSFSMNNNPGANPTPVFSLKRWGIYLIIIVAVAVGCLVYRMVTDKRFGGKSFWKKKRLLLSGMLVLAAGYVLGGSFSAAWKWGYIVRKSILFSLLQLVVIAAPYYLMTGFVDWEKAPRNYLLWVGMGMAGLVFFQVFHIYIAKDVMVNGAIMREEIANGWGMRNNIGGMLAMMIPCVCYLGVRHKKEWLGLLLGALLLGAIVMTTSRSSLLFGCLIWAVCLLLYLHRVLSRRAMWGLFAVGLLCVIGGIVALWGNLTELALKLLGLDNVLDPNSRTVLYAEGFKQFLRYPVFGGSFFPIGYTPYDWSTVDSFSGIFPPRWHNTVIQLLASTGVVGLCTYGFHRFQTVALFLKKRTKENLYLALSIAVLLLTSMLDCHFFNFGPVLFYSIALAFIESTPDETRKNL